MEKRLLPQWRTRPNSAATARKMLLIPEGVSFSIFPPPSLSRPFPNSVNKTISIYICVVLRISGGMDFLGKSVYPVALFENSVWHLLLSSCKQSIFDAMCVCCLQKPFLRLWRHIYKYVGIHKVMLYSTFTQDVDDYEK